MQRVSRADSGQEVRTAAGSGRECTAGVGRRQRTSSGRTSRRTGRCCRRDVTVPALSTLGRSPQLEGVLGWEWRSVFTPSWLALAPELAVALLACGEPSGVDRRSEPDPAREHVRFIWRQVRSPVITQRATFLDRGHTAFGCGRLIRDSESVPPSPATSRRCLSYTPAMPIAGASPWACRSRRPLRAGSLVAYSDSGRGTAPLSEHAAPDGRTGRLRARRIVRVLRVLLPSAPWARVSARGTRGRGGCRRAGQCF